MADRRRAFESVSKKRYEPERREVPGKRPTLASGGFHLARWVGALSRNANGNAARLTCQDGGATLGAVVPPPGYLQAVAEICRRHGVLLIADEVMTGMGRTGRNFAVEAGSVTPDILV